MRINQDNRQVIPPHSLVLSNNSISDVDIDLKITNNKVSPETYSYRLQKGWHHLQESGDSFLNNNNNNECALDVNDNGNSLDDTASIVASSSSEQLLVEGDYRNMSEDESSSDSSSDDESSESFSDTSPLLDVSSLGNSDDSDMSEDSSSSSSDSEEDCGNNNHIEEDEDMSMGEPSMQSSWMSFSSAASSSPSVAPGHSRVLALPDVLPISEISKEKSMDNFYSSVNTEDAKLEKKISSRDISDKTFPRDCCLGQNIAQPNVQIGERVKSSETRSINIKHGNTYPREARSNKRYLKNRDINAWIVNDSFEEHYDDRNTKFSTLDEGIRLNNFTVNGYKTLSLTELVNTKAKEDDQSFNKSEADNHTLKMDTLTQKPLGTVFANTYQNFERNYSKLPANVHLCSKDNWRHKKDTNNAVLEKNSPENNESSDISKFSSKFSEPEFESKNSNKKSNEKTILMAKQTDIDPNLDSETFKKIEKLPPSSLKITKKESTYYSGENKFRDDKVMTPELFEVYTMDTALPQTNWTAMSKKKKESEWIRKRRNDREEIRRKLAMDSDTEDYISEKLSQHRKSAGSLDHLKSAGNLQICFMNEAAKDFSNPEDEASVENSPLPVPRTQKPALHLLASSQHSVKNQSTPIQPQNSLSPKVSVIKRQRPKFFFNRPRSWHASKQAETPFPEEDLLTRHVRLQAEAREALAQAKDMARMQMEIERQKKKKSPIADIVGLPFPDGKHLLTHHALVAMNVAQLQVIVNDLHSQIETLNEDLVKFLLERDDLHMEQDSMLVDIEDLTRYLGLKESGSVSSSSSQISVNTSDQKKLNKENV